jgi:hypothetical protein
MLRKRNLIETCVGMYMSGAKALRLNVPLRSMPVESKSANNSSIRMRCDGIQFRYFAGGVVLQGVKGCEGSFSVPGGQK